MRSKRRSQPASITQSQIIIFEYGHLEGAKVTHRTSKCAKRGTHDHYNNKDVTIEELIYSTNDLSMRSVCVCS